MPSKKQKSFLIPDDIYEMEAILAYKQDKNTDFYKIKWKNYSEEEATWEPRKNIINPDEEQIEIMKKLKNEALSGRSNYSQIIDFPNSIPTPTGTKLDALSTKRVSFDNEILSTSNSNSSFSQIEVSIDTTKNEKSIIHSTNEYITTPNTQNEPPIQNSYPKNNNYPYVAHIREFKKQKKVFMNYPDDGTGREGFFIDLEEARANHKDALLDYLLPRIRYKGHSKEYESK